MSKRERMLNRAVQTAPISRDSEYTVIRHDLYKVLALNAVYLVVLLVLYFTNKNTHYVDNFFARLLHF